ncbi:nucleotidyltransferase domain-containing protein [Geoalkalibacter halelectricus]|uniref:nucleotidyltransferase domain-containing protein n=1 Tax=Geoalkalibacter halelectricus TaxID=2847045 RepID=UPI003D2187E0
MEKNRSKDELLVEILRRILQITHPLQVVLFGSAARKQMQSHSDFDLLVIVPNGQHRRHTTQAIYQNLVGVGFAADIIVVTEADVERYRQTPGLIIKSALDEGITLYAA